MTKKLTGIRFFFKGGGFMTAVVTEEEAHAILRGWGWKEGELNEFVGDTEPPPGCWKWAVELDSVVAVHTLDLSQPQQQQAQPGQAPGFPRVDASSGYYGG